MRLTIKAIIRWEQLNKKPFAKLNYADENDITSLFYTCIMSEPFAEQKSFKEFKETLTEAAIKEMIGDFERQTLISAQYQDTPKKNGKESKEDAEPIYIKEIVPMLIMAGLDVYYALNDMELCDLNVFLAAYDQRNKERLTIERLWTFIQVSPNLRKEIKTPKDLHPFPWELEPEEISEEKLVEGINEFKAFMQTGLKK